MAKEWGLRGAYSEPVKFGVGANISAVVLPDDSATFLYYFGGKSLAEILDQNVRGYVQDRLSYEFGRRTLSKCKAEKGAIFASVEREVQSEFKKKGLTILYFGSYKGLLYENERVQTSIDGEYLQKIAKKVADRTEEAQRVRNKTNVLIAEAERRAAEAYHQAEAALEFQTDLTIALMRAEAAKTIAERTKGQLPTTILPSENSAKLLLSLPNVP